MQQLDIFADSRDRVLINRLAEALCDGALAQAGQALAELSQTFPSDRHLGSAAVLMQTLADEQAPGQALSQHSAAAKARAQLAGAVSAAALLVLGAGAAQPWLAQRWQALASTGKHWRGARGRCLLTAKPAPTTAPTPLRCGCRVAPGPRQSKPPAPSIPGAAYLHR